MEILLGATIPETVILAENAKLEDLNNEHIKGVCIEKNVINTNTEQWAIVAKLLKKTHLLYSVENNMTSTISMMGETSLYGDEELPDNGTFINVFMKTIPNLEYIIIGKPNLHLDVDSEKSILIGDTETDFQQAENLNIDFIKVGSEYDFPFFNGNHYEIRNINTLADSLRL